MRRPPPDLAARRLTSAADLKGDADGVATKSELESLARDLETRSAADFDGDAAGRAARARRLVREAGADGVRTLDPVLERLPSPVRRLALQLDALWGDADGALTLEEIDRVASYYLSAVAFFHEDAERLLGLASRLGLAPDAPLPEAGNLLELRTAVLGVTPDDVEKARPFRELLDEAIEASDIPGAPELLRDADLHSPTYHHLSVLDHTTMAVRAVDALCDRLGTSWPDGAAVMLLHDVGKVLDRVPRPDRGENHYSYWDHETEGAEWLKERGIDEDIVFQVRHHMVLRPSSAREVRAIAGGDRRRLAHMVIVYCADQLAKGATPAQIESFAEQRPKILELARDAGLDGDKLLAATTELREKWFAGVPLPEAPA